MKKEPAYLSDAEFEELLNKVDPKDVILMHQVLTINCQSKATSRNDDHAVKGVESKITNTNKMICKPFNFGLILAAVYILGVLSALWVACPRIFLCKGRIRRKKKKAQEVELIVKNQTLEDNFDKKNQHLMLQDNSEKKNFWKN